MNELALFAGAGGGILGGTLLGWRTVCAVEWEPYAASVLIQRQNDGILPAFPIWDDVRTFDGRPGLEAMVKWSTPTAHNAKETNAPSESNLHTPTLAAQAGGALNPTWVEWLMGWPLGWTDLKPLEMDKYQQWQHSHGLSSDNASNECGKHLSGANP